MKSCLGLRCSSSRQCLVACRPSLRHPDKGSWRNCQDMVFRCRTACHERGMHITYVRGKAIKIRHDFGRGDKITNIPQSPIDFAATQDSRQEGDLVASPPCITGPYPPPAWECMGALDPLVVSFLVSAMTPTPDRDKEGLADRLPHTSCGAR